MLASVEAGDQLVGGGVPPGQDDARPRGCQHAAITGWPGAPTARHRPGSWPLRCGNSCSHVEPMVAPGGALLDSGYAKPPIVQIATRSATFEAAGTV